MTVPRILLLTSHPPGCVGVGGIFLGALCRVYPKDSIACFAIAPHKLRQIDPELAWLPIEFADVPRQTGFRRLGSSMEKMTGFPVHTLVNLFYVPQVVECAIRFAQRNKTNLIWAVLDDPILIHVARQIAKALDIELVTTVWDPPALLTQNLHYDALSTQQTLREFDHVLGKSARLSVASDSMAAEYHRRYAKETYVMIHSSADCKPPSSGLKNPRSVTIGFAGSLYATQEWESLLQALHTVNWIIGGREVVIRFLGNHVLLRSHNKMNIEYLGWRSAAETVDILATCDLAYLPYKFDDSFRLAAKLCFPNKLSVYLAAGIPVFYHGPEDSSPMEFCKRYPVAVGCHTQDTTTIVQQLECLINNANVYTACVAAGQNALNDELNLSTFYERFAGFIGISLEELHIIEPR